MADLQACPESGGRQLGQRNVDAEDEKIAIDAV
jgi:hypothetical protein